MKSRRGEHNERQALTEHMICSQSAVPIPQPEQPNPGPQIISAKELQRWGAAIRYRRRDLDLTLKQLAEITGISFGYLAKLERGDEDAKNPTRLVIDALRGALNIPPPGGAQLSRTALVSWVNDEPSKNGLSQGVTRKNEGIPQSEGNSSSSERW